MKYCGSLSAPIQGSMIYFIFACNLLYIGETQNHPVQRWNAHLFTDNGFLRMVKECGDPEIDYLSNIKLFAYYCHSIIENFPEIEWKTATQAVEHEIHCCVLQYPSKLRRLFTLISDTERTAPRRFKHWDFARKIAMDILDDLSKAMLELGY
jgi:hypothetical protein